MYAMNSFGFISNFYEVIIETRIFNGTLLPNMN